MSFIQPILLDANHVVKFVQEDHFTYALFHTKSDKCLWIFCATRFATSYYVLERLLEVCANLVDVAIYCCFDALLSKHKGFAIVGIRCIWLITSTPFWIKLQNIADIVKPFVELLHIVDIDKFVMARVYWLISQDITKMKDNDKFIARKHKKIVGCAIERWNMLHTP